MTRMTYGENESEEALREAICTVGRLLSERGFVASHDGNISVRLGPDRFLMTPSGVNKGRMTPQMLLVTDGEGRVLADGRPVGGSCRPPCANSASNGYLPSSEAKMHRAIYAVRSDVGAVVHAHPRYSTAFSIRRQGLTVPYVAEQIIGVGPVPVTDGFALPSTDEVPRSLEPFIADHNAVLLSNHGSVAWGKDLWEAFDRLEAVEHLARTIATVEMLGGGVALSADEIARLQLLADAGAHAGEAQ